MIKYLKNNSKNKFNFYIFRDILLDVFKEEFHFSRSFFTKKEFNEGVRKINEKYIFIFWASKKNSNVKMAFDEDGDYLSSKSVIETTGFITPTLMIKEKLSKFNISVSDSLTVKPESYFYDQTYGDGIYFDFIKILKPKINYLKEEQNTENSFYRIEATVMNSRNKEDRLKLFMHFLKTKDMQRNDISKIIEDINILSSQFRNSGTDISSEDVSALFSEISSKLYSIVWQKNY